ncbi:hypothetical protein [Lysobacter fragariae]
MNRFEALSERALELAQDLRGNVQQHLPRAGKLLEAGAKLGVVKSGARVAGKFARRNPVLVAATIAGAGLLWYAAHRRAKRLREMQAAEPIESTAHRLPPKRVDARRAGTRKAKTNGHHAQGAHAGSE